MRELRVLSPTGAFGVTPFVESSFMAGLQRDPHVIGIDAGSNDLGPYGLGADADLNPIAWERRSMTLLLRAAVERGIPLILGSAGHAGTDRGVDHLLRLVREVQQQERLPGFKVAGVYAEVDKAWLKRRLREGRVASLEGAPDLTAEAVDESTHIVAMMGPEPIARALEQGAQVVITGRTVDEAIFSALPILQGYPKGLAEHLGKVLECASLSGEPYMSRSSLLGIIRDDELIFEPMHPDQICTPQSVAAHSLYERLDPYMQAGPGGHLDLSQTTFEQVSPRATRVRGTVWRKAQQYTVKLEGAAWCGFRRLGIVGLRDRVAVESIDRILAYTRAEVADSYPGLDGAPHGYELYFHVYGKNGVLGDFEPRHAITSHELCVVIETVARDEELAEGVTALAIRKAFIARYPGQMATGGGGAMLTDEVLKGNDGYRWSVHHAVELSDPCEIFRLKLLDY